MFAFAASAAARDRFLMNTVSAAGRCSGGTHPGHAMDRPPADGDDIVEGAPEGQVPIALAPGQRGKTEFRPLRGVDAELDQTVPPQLRRYGGGRNVIGKLQLDGFEPRRGGGAEALDQRAFGEQMAEIGGKARHGVSWLSGER